MLGAPFRAVGHAFVQTFKRSRTFAIVSVVLVLVCAVGLVDTGLSWGKVHQGVSVGTVDLSGKTITEAENAIRATYEERLDDHQMFVFANEETANSLVSTDGIIEGEELSEQLSYEEAQQNKQLWVATGPSVRAELPAAELARQAMAVGREDGGFFTRAALLFGGRSIEVRGDYGEEELESLAHDIDTAIGEPRVDFDIAIEDGVATVTEGHSGAMIDRAALRDKLDEILLRSESATGSFVARAEYAPLRIEREQAQVTCDAVNGMLQIPVSFTHEGGTVEVDGAQLGEWISTEVKEVNGTYRLLPLIDEEVAQPALISLMNQSGAANTKTANGGDLAITFQKFKDEVMVVTQSEILLPLLNEALAQLDGQLLGPFRTDSGSAAPATLDPIPIDTYRYSGSLSFDEACDYGVIGRIASYTTNYTSTSATKNRNHNIHLAADLLNDSICTADGGTWSFNDTTGDCNEEAGFLAAGAIREGKYIDEAGGGICQVATTMFNAVYESGFPVLKRAPHSLYMASYEAGRDAAVNYPNLDLVWQNDSASDVIVRTSYTDTSVTVALYGVDPGYTVKTSTGEWQEGKKFRVIVEVDDTKETGWHKTDTVGTDGREITVVRTVYDREGNRLREATFNSTYNPIDKIVIAGPDTEIEVEEGREKVTRKHVKEDDEDE